MRKNWRIVLGGIVIVLIGLGMFVGQRANYVAAQNHTAVDDAGILYTFFKIVGYCPDSPESAVFQLARYGFESRTDDPWGEKYQYHCSTGLIEKVCSFGTDQSLGGDDDICVTHNGVRRGNKSVKSTRDWRRVVELNMIKKTESH